MDDPPCLHPADRFRIRSVVRENVVPMPLREQRFKIKKPLIFPQKRCIMINMERGNDSTLTYVSLFSSAGVGCFGFKQAGFECVATNELIERRIDIQRFNHKCKYETGYVCGDLTSVAIRQQILDQISLWRANERMDRLDVLIATPPCQGMSVANHKKTTTEIVRNSLVIESIRLIQEINPRFFILENVPAFMKTLCTDVDGQQKTIGEAIWNNLGASYSYVPKVINFKNYGACSSRQRTIVIGVANDIADEISPWELFPDYCEERTLRSVIGELKPLTEMGEIDENDIYHAFRPYPEYMRAWIADLKEGESAFDQEDEAKRPQHEVNGVMVPNIRKNGDKYKRQYWDKVGPCIHTRNDQLASQNTIHPSDDRVFSIRELMLMMTVPHEFKWNMLDESDLNELSLEDKKKFLKNEEIKIRQSLGEAVPTAIFRSIAINIKAVLNSPYLSSAQINKIISEHKLNETGNLLSFIDENPLNLSFTVLSRIAELANSNRVQNAAYFTGKSLITEMMKNLPDINTKDEVTVLEPSVGVGNFLPLIMRRFEGKEVWIDAVDIDEDSIKVLNALMNHLSVPKSCHIHCITDDFLTHEFSRHYDYIIGNPPFGKLNSSNKLLPIYRARAVNKDTCNICSFFLDRAITLADCVCLVLPKFMLNTPEFNASRQYLSSKCIDSVIDFGEKGFPGVLIETIAICVKCQGKPGQTRVISVPMKIDIMQKQRYICDVKLPYWVVFRDKSFDEVYDGMDFDVFTVFRDRQITNQLLNASHGIRVLKSRNITDDGEVVDIAGYDSYIEESTASSLAVHQYLDRDDVFLTPNMTYNPRVMRKSKGTLVNGSVAILIPKEGINPTQEQLSFYSSEKYRRFYRIARNYQTRSLNVDNCSVYFYGLLKENEVQQDA